MIYPLIVDIESQHHDDTGHRTNVVLHAEPANPLRIGYMGSQNDANTMSDNDANNDAG
jgi:hypothetical protein